MNNIQLKEILMVAQKVGLLSIIDVNTPDELAERKLQAFTKAIILDMVSKLEPRLYLRMKDGKPDWSDDCVCEDYQALTEDSSMDDGVYSALPLYDLSVFKDTPK